MRLQRQFLRSRDTDLLAMEPVVFRIAARPPMPQPAAPQGSNRTITATEDVNYVFSQSDFGYSDSDGNAFAGLVVTTVPANGAIGVNGSSITPGVFVSAATIQSGQFFFEAGLNANGNAFASFTFQVRDSTGAQDASPNTITINVTPVNDPPAYRNFNSGSAGMFTEGQTTPVRLDQQGNGLVEDVDSANFAGGYLKLSIMEGGKPSEDQLGIGTLGGVSVSGTAAGSSVAVNGVVIGTIAAGGSGVAEDLVITLNASATPAQVQVLVRALTYFNVSENPSQDTRIIKLSLNDGDGPDIGSTNLTVGVMGLNDAPALSDPTASQLSYLPGDPLIPLWAGVTMTDPDNQPNFIQGAINMGVGGADAIVELTGNRFTVNNAGFLVDNSTGQTVGSIFMFRGTVQISGFSNSVTAEVVNALIHSFGFRTGSDTPELGNYDAALTFSDGAYMFGGNLTSNMVHQTITVGNPSPVPIVDLNGAGFGIDAQVFYVEDGTPVGLVMGNAVILDANAGNQLDKMILSLFDPQSSDVLTWGQLPAGVTVTVTEADFHRLITFSGPATPLEYQHLLESVRYATTSDTPISQRSIEISVASDGTESAVARTNISIQEHDDPGVAHDDLFFAGTADPFFGNLGFDNGFGSDQDPDGYYLTAVNGSAGNLGQTVALGSGATLNVSQFGGFTFEQHGAYAHGGVVSFTYTLRGDTTARATIVVGANGPGILGTSGADALQGTANGDVLMGQAGRDYLSGGDGNDFLIGGAGIDRLEGGTGADHFVFTSTADSHRYAMRSDGHKNLPDTIVDFVQGADKIDLGAIDAIANTQPNEAFTFIGPDAFTHQAGQVRFEIAGNQTSVYADLDGDGRADMQIALFTPVALTAADFVL
jgi:hypothetical protein